ncbi:hypothetical protein [Vulcanisaeta thermophila]|uniref:hypothetical protein n=1 Tax=Vulcanisaeta thermophila TaxID=867917 RepID=UPI000853A895|nr:hypothetical protein [Vulcanisaeta thermophila]
MDPYVIGAFINDCSLRWRAVEGFEDAVGFLKGLEPRVVVEGGFVTLRSGCEELSSLRERPLRALLMFTIVDWVRLLRGLYDFNGDLFDPEPRLDAPNLVLMIRVPSIRFGQVIRVVLKFLGVSSDVFRSENGIFVVIHEGNSLARFIKTVRPHVDPSLSIALRDKWLRHYGGVGNPIVLTQSV